MEIQTRRNRTIQQDENVYGLKGKMNLVSSKVSGLTVRGVLGEVNSNVQIIRDPKAQLSTDLDKKLLKSSTRRAYGHVQSKIDTGLTAKCIQPSSRPPLRREESTGGLARAAILTRAAAKEALKKEIEIECNNVVAQTRKTTREVRKPVHKLNLIKETTKQTKLKPILKDPTESLGKLKLVESTEKCSTVNFEEKSPPSLPADIEDIDADDHSPLLMSVYIKDIYRYLTELEGKYQIEENHLKNQSMISPHMRATLIDWLVELQCQFSLLLETFQLTVGIIDLYLQAVPNIKKERLQLIGVTAMFIASKYEEIYAPDIKDFVYITDNSYTKYDILRYEKEIMAKLGFCLARPIPLSFLRRFIKAAHGSSKNHHLAKYFVDLCLVEYSMAHYRPSELAAAAICLSLHLLSNSPLQEIWTPTLSYYSGYALTHLKPIIRRIATIVLNVEKSRYQAVYTKYSDITLARVSTLPHLKGEAIYELAQSSS